MDHRQPVAAERGQECGNLRFGPRIGPRLARVTTITHGALHVDQQQGWPLGQSLGQSRGQSRGQSLTRR